jgi:hypothetical protein
MGYVENQIMKIVCALEVLLGMELNVYARVNIQTMGWESVFQPIVVVAVTNIWIQTTVDSVDSI